MGGIWVKYTVIIEKGPNSYGAYVPDLPGCVAAGKTKVEALRLIQEAIEFHLEGIRLHHHRIPARRTMATEVLVPA
jgi:predicted RNase H-like HicB family nuclease